MEAAPQLPVKCIKRLMERRELRSDLPYDRMLQVEVEPTPECVDILEDIVLRGEFRLGRRLYLVKKITRGQDEAHRLFSLGKGSDKNLTIEAVGVRASTQEKPDDSLDQNPTPPLP